MCCALGREARETVREPRASAESTAQLDESDVRGIESGIAPPVRHSVTTAVVRSATRFFFARVRVTLAGILRYYSAAMLDIAEARRQCQLFIA